MGLNKYFACRVHIPLDISRLIHISTISLFYISLSLTMALRSPSDFDKLISICRHPCIYILHQVEVTVTKLPKKMSNFCQICMPSVWPLSWVHAACRNLNFNYEQLSVVLFSKENIDNIQFVRCAGLKYIPRLINIDGMAYLISIYRLLSIFHILLEFVFVCTHKHGNKAPTIIMVRIKWDK